MPVGEVEPAPGRRMGLGRRVMEGLDGLDGMIDRKPMDRLRLEIALYHDARGTADPRRRQQRLDELDGRPSHRDARAQLVRMLRKAEARSNNPLMHLRLIQTGMAWLVEVDGMSSAAVPEIDALKGLPGRARAGQTDTDLALRRIATLVEQGSRATRPAPAPRAPAQPKESAASTATFTRGVFALLVLLGTLGVGMHVGRLRAQTLPVPVAPPQPPARITPVATVAVPSSENAFLPLLRDAMEVYVGRVHRVKNHLSIASRFEGDPDGLVANLFEPENYRELTAVLERSRAELARLSSKVAAASPAFDREPGFATLIARGERVLAGSLDTLKRLEADHRSGAAPDLPARAEEEVGRLAREVRAFSSDLCAVSDRHALTPRDLVEDVVNRAPFRDAVSISAPDDLPASFFVPDADRARSGLANALGNLLDNAHQAGARRIGVQLAFESGALTVAVSDDGPGVAPEVQARLFAPRVTTRPEGTGMGLFGARKALQEIGGDAGHTAPAQGGAEFWLRVPALAA